MVSGMERSGASAHGWRRTPRTADTYGDGRNDIVARIAGDIAAGLTVRQIADKRHLPVDFVDMAVERADKRGLLAVMDMRHACGETICQPDWCAQDAHSGYSHLQARTIGKVNKTKNDDSYRFARGDTYGLSVPDH